MVNIDILDISEEQESFEHFILWITTFLLSLIFSEWW